MQRLRALPLFAGLIAALVVLIFRLTIYSQDIKILEIDHENAPLTASNTFDSGVYYNGYVIKQFVYLLFICGSKFSSIKSKNAAVFIGITFR